MLIPSFNWEQHWSVSRWASERERTDRRQLANYRWMVIRWNFIGEKFGRWTVHPVNSRPVNSPRWIVLRWNVLRWIVRFSLFRLSLRHYSLSQINSPTEFRGKGNRWRGKMIEEQCTRGNHREWQKGRVMAKWEAEAREGRAELQSCRG